MKRTGYYCSRNQHWGKTREKSVEKPKKKILQKKGVNLKRLHSAWEKRTWKGGLLVRKASTFQKEGLIRKPNKSTNRQGVFGGSGVRASAELVRDEFEKGKSGKGKVVFISERRAGSMAPNNSSM